MAGKPTQRLDESFPALLPSVREIRMSVAAIAEECGLAGSDLDDVLLAVSEAATNAVVHGSRGDDRCIRVSVHLADGEIEIVVCDDGDGIQPHVDSPGAGLGLPVIGAVAKRLALFSSDRGTELRMVFACPATAA